MKSYTFDAIIKKHEGIDAAYIEFPYDTETEFGTKGQVKVLATFDGYEYRGSLAKMGLPCHCIGLTQKVRSAIGKHPGDIVHVTVLQDTVPRVIEVPGDFKKLLEENTDVNMVFEALSYTHKKEYVDWINSARKHETRAKRMTASIEMLLKKVKHP